MSQDDDGEVHLSPSPGLVEAVVTGR